MMKQNCWEVKNCGREQGGSHAQELGVCPTSVEKKLDGMHHGKNAGRACWVVAGTFCGGEPQGTFAQKYHQCETCSFYSQVQKEEFPSFFLAVQLLRKVKETKPYTMVDNGSEKRGKKRTHLKSGMRRASLRPEGTDKEILGVVIDNSTVGFQISISEEIAPQTIIFLTITDNSESGSGESEEFIAKICWCKKDIFFQGFDVGVQILGYALKE